MLKPAKKVPAYHGPPPPAPADPNAKPTQYVFHVETKSDFIGAASSSYYIVAETMGEALETYLSNKFKNALDLYRVERLGKTTEWYDDPPEDS